MDVVDVGNRDSRAVGVVGTGAGWALVPRALMVASLVLNVSDGTSAKAQTAVASFRVTGTAIAEPLDGKSGDAARGRQIVLDRATGNCLICHKVPNEPNERFQGELGPDLTEVGARLNAGEIRLRMVDQARLNPATIMPPYHRVDGLNRVAPEWRGKPVLSAQEIEDIVAYLAGLK